MAKKRKLRIASYNINGINSRLHVLLRWLEEFQPDVVGLQELKCLDKAFPAKDLEALGYSAIWHGQEAGTASRSSAESASRSRPGGDFPAIPRTSRAVTSRRRLRHPDRQLYLPNGNPWPGAKFDYKLAWMDRLYAHARHLLDSGLPAI